MMFEPANPICVFVFPRANGLPTSMRMCHESEKVHTENYPHAFRPLQDDTTPFWFTDDELDVIQSALRDKRVETSRYLNPHVHQDHDPCCEQEAARIEHRAEVNAALHHRHMVLNSALDKVLDYLDVVALDTAARA